MKALYLDCISGISGDMFIGALLDAGADPVALEQGLKQLGIAEEYELTWRKVIKNGITATKFDVLLQESHEHGHVHVHPHSHGHEHTHIHIHNHAHEHEHLHEHVDDHGHAHEHTHGHAHSHDHEHTHSHGHSHDHEHTHGHAHSHDHEHTHSHAHSHDHEHTHGHGHSHDHEHTHSHGHSHDHEHTHGHAHSHDHEHTHSHAHSHDHEHTHGHGHSHDHEHTHGHAHSHDHEHTHGHAHSHDHEHTHSHAHSHDHRSYHDIVKLIEDAQFNETVTSMALRIFRKIAEAEGKIHGVPLEQVHFHEVGAVDSIIDIVGAAILLDHLQVETIYASRVPVGSGKIRIDHGIYPVPAPATLEILKGVPLEHSAIRAELTTPTGAAIAAVMAQQFGPLPSMTVNSIGYGAGTKSFGEHPNVLRVMLGETV